MADVDAHQAARVALGEQDSETALESTSSGDDEGSGGSKSWVERLWDGDAPGPSTSQLKAEYDLPGWAYIGLRGVLRVATGQGVPPIVEIMLSIALAIMSRESSDSGDEGGETGSGAEALDIEEVA